MGSKKDDLTVGNKAPQLRLMDKDGNEVSLEDFKGRWIVLYFYPKDNTSGCTQEAIDFSSAKREFEELNAVILGASPDSIESHCKFAEKNNLSITLLSDMQHGVLESYGAWQLKKMYGNEYMGVVRSTFLIDPEGKIRKIWRKVKVKGHVEEVRDALQQLVKR
jgi:peroxiredoxin Q/BCP